MFRTDAEGNDSNRYTEGNFALGEPATVVSAAALNSFQEEICNVVEAAGITLVKAEENQLIAAIKAIIGVGGTVVSASISNNAGPITVPGLGLSQATTKSVKMLCDVYRKTDSAEHREQIELTALYKITGGWVLHYTSQGDDAGVSFSIDGSGVIKYTSDNMLGANYSGSLRVSNIVKVPV